MMPVVSLVPSVPLRSFCETKWMPMPPRKGVGTLVASVGFVPTRRSSESGALSPSESSSKGFEGGVPLTSSPSLRESPSVSARLRFVPRDRSRPSLKPSPLLSGLLGSDWLVLLLYSCKAVQAIHTLVACGISGLGIAQVIVLLPPARQAIAVGIRQRIGVGFKLA